MNNYKHPGDTLSVPAVGDVTSGSGVLVNELFGVAVADADSGDNVEIKLTGVFSLPKVSAQAWAIGELVYWDPDNDRCTTLDGTGEVEIGVVAAVAANPTSTGDVRLNGKAAT